MMQESFKNRKDKSEPEKMGRRKFLGLFSGALSAAALGGTAGLALIKKEGEESAQLAENVDVPYDPEALENLMREEDRIASLEGTSNSKFFITEVVAQADRYERELPVVLQFAQEITVKDPEGRSRMDYVQQMLHADGVPEAVLKEIKKQMVGLAFEESRYDAERESGEHARGILQIIPSTWEDLSKEGENALSLVDQTRVAGELLSQTYAHLQTAVGDELQAIEAEFFHGDTEAFEKCFMAPVLINAYNAGMGTMAKLIYWFARTHEQAVGIFDQEKQLSGYDVFMAMAKKGKADEPVPAYKEDASAYTLKVYGAALCLLSHPSQVTQA
jgi:hypothetical protein